MGRDHNAFDSLHPSPLPWLVVHRLPVQPLFQPLCVSFALTLSALDAAMALNRVAPSTRVCQSLEGVCTIGWLLPFELALLDLFQLQEAMQDA